MQSAHVWRRPSCLRSLHLAYAEKVPSAGRMLGMRQVAALLRL